MRKAEITVRFEQERLRALEFYIAKKDSTLEAEIDDFMAKLYEKYVPAQTREYIESMESREERPPRQQRPRPTRPVRARRVPSAPDASRAPRHFGERYGQRRGALMAGRNRRRCRMSRRVSHPAKAISIRAPPSAKAPVRSRVPKRAVARKPSGLDGILKETKYRGILHRPAPQKFDSVAARRAPCRVLWSGVASLPQWAGKPAVRGFFGATCERTEAAILRA